MLGRGSSQSERVSSSGGCEQHEVALKRCEMRMNNVPVSESQDGHSTQPHLPHAAEWPTNRARSRSERRCSTAAINRFDRPTQHYTQYSPSSLLATHSLVSARLSVYIHPSHPLTMSYVSLHPSIRRSCSCALFSQLQLSPQICIVSLLWSLLIVLGK